MKVFLYFPRNKKMEKRKSPQLRGSHRRHRSRAPRGNGRPTPSPSQPASTASLPPTSTASVHRAGQLLSSSRTLPRRSSCRRRATPSRSRENDRDGDGQVALHLGGGGRGRGGDGRVALHLAGGGRSGVRGVGGGRGPEHEGASAVLQPTPVTRRCPRRLPSTSSIDRGSRTARGAWAAAMPPVVGNIYSLTFFFKVVKDYCLGRRIKFWVFFIKYNRWLS
jgi:hypothetical protein